MLELEAALDRIFAALPPPLIDQVPLEKAHGRFLAEPVQSRVALPLFDNSAMDGYAVRSSDTAASSKEKPDPLRLIGRIEAGQQPSCEVTSGTCARIFTGSALPPGADAVVMQEDTRAEGENIFVLDGVKPWENIRFAGEDVKAGAVLAEAGQKLTPALLGLLAATGCAEVHVGRQPRVAMLATGSELRMPPDPLSLGQIYESNRLMLAGLLQRSGALVKIHPIVPDDPARTDSALQLACHDSDIVLTSGGVSVGEMDFVKSAFERLGGSLQFWKVAIRPGRPFVFGKLQNQFLFGLPGNPVSALVTFLLLVRPAILRWQGARDTALSTHPAIADEAITNDGDRRHFVRVRIDATGKVFSSGVQASHILSSLAAANGLLDLAPRSQVTPGATVNVLRWDY